MNARRFWGFVLALLAGLVIAVGWGETLSPTSHWLFPIRVADEGAGPVVLNVRGPANAIVPPDVRAGDAVDIESLGLVRRIRLQFGAPPGTTLTVRTRHDGVWTAHILTAYDAPKHPFLQAWALLFVVTVGGLIVAIVAFRRPSLATAALVFWSANAITSSGAATLFVGLPDPFFSIWAVLSLTIFTSWPAIALVPFITRFPHPAATRDGRLRVAAGDAVFWAYGCASLLEFLNEPLILKSWPQFDTFMTYLSTIASVAFAALVFAAVRGEDRRRIGWVIAGYVIASIGSLGFNLLDSVVFGARAPTNELPWFVVPMSAAVLAEVAFPIALAYAVLRYRVLDVGFVVNRAVVYAFVTATIVVVISFVDWISGKLISESRIAVAAEAAVTIAFGVALHTVHARIEKFVDRFIFRARYVAERRMQSAIDALAFATTERAIDVALVEEATTILGLQCAAVYRRSEKTPDFRLCGAVGWPETCASSLDENSLLVRTIRAQERTLFIADLGVVDPSLPASEHGPAVAVPIATQHTVIGIALYGNDRDGGSPDPEILALLGRMCSSAATAYSTVEARELRLQLIDLQQRLGPRALAAE
jgi:hypothetical protein